ncbi:MAG: threonine-phosphate decarboxylase [Candidatus Omnitrophica bacterium]|nr:threonine-phosphate decarboxylase [Candidatus Omnitrophota bacterium]
MKPSLHGGNVREFAKQFGVPEPEVVDFSVNTNPWGPPESVLECYRYAAHLLSTYPDPESGLLKREVARHFPLWPENVIAGNGSTELIYLLIQLLKPRSALLLEPSFLEYRRALNLQGVQVRSVRLPEKNNFAISLQEILNAVRGVDLFILANPNNPTGNLLGEREVLQVLEEMKRRGIFTLVDEAFIDWAPADSVAPAINDGSYFFLIRSLTKFFNLPGIRIGYGLGPRRLIERLEQQKITWSVNGLAEALGVEALRDRDFQEESRKRLAAEKEFLSPALAAIPELKLFPSAANFYLLKLRAGFDAAKLAMRLADDKIMVRDASNFAGLDNQFFRVSIRARYENQLLVQALRAAWQERHDAR